MCESSPTVDILHQLSGLVFYDIGTVKLKPKYWNDYLYYCSSFKDHQVITGPVL